MGTRVAASKITYLYPGFPIPSILYTQQIFSFLHFLKKKISYLVSTLSICEGLALFAEVQILHPVFKSLNNVSVLHVVFTSHGSLTRAWIPTGYILFLLPCPPTTRLVHAVFCRLLQLTDSPFLGTFTGKYPCMCSIWLKSLGETKTLSFLLYFPHCCCDEEDCRESTQVIIEYVH